MSNGKDNNNEPPIFPEGGSPPPDGNGNGGIPLESGKPAVAAAPGKMMFVLLGAGVFLAIVIHALFFGSKAPEQKPQKTIKDVVVAESKAPPEQPPLPSPPPVEVQAPPPPPPPAIATPPNPEFKSTSTPNNEALKARVRSSMIVSGGGGGVHLPGGGSEAKKKANPVGGDANTAFAESLEGTTADHVLATQVGDLNVTIAQGKIIHAVLETAINTDLPGPLRAIVSHDIYAEAGKSILIPKGSRLIGLYNPGIKRGQTRVFVIWTRVIRPDGIDVAINSPGVDSLGRAGLAGDVDDKYFEAFSAAFLTSVLDIGTAVAGQAVIGNNNDTTTQSTTAAGPTTTTTGTAGSAATQQAVQNIGQVGTSIVSSTLTLAPTITVDQGTPVNVFVNRDVTFPSSLAGLSHFVQ